LPKPILHFKTSRRIPQQEVDLEPGATTSRVRSSLDCKAHIPIYQVAIATKEDKDYNFEEINFGSSTLFPY